MRQYTLARRLGGGGSDEELQWRADGAGSRLVARAGREEDGHLVRQVRGRSQHRGGTRLKRRGKGKLCLLRAELGGCWGGDHHTGKTEKGAPPSEKDRLALPGSLRWDR